ncbi:MAG TPA: hypothetical protein VMZ06_05720 [Candidatus Bathyarchaeia archaeon]|nr:hypothetical protein [Candidatus Bathyarchaeia archaeon]
MSSIVASPESHESQWCSFGRYLDHIGYADCIYSIGNMPYAQQNCYGFVKEVRSLLPFELRTAMRLLFLRDSVEEAQLARTSLHEYLPVLIDSGIAIRNSGMYIRMNTLYCHVVDGCYLFVTAPDFAGEIKAYFGDDSIKLSRHLPGQHGQAAIDFAKNNVRFISARQGSTRS